MNTEREILSYLQTYGNTKESDLVDYGIRRLGQSSGDMRSILDELTVAGKINRVVHEKLKPQATYAVLVDPGLELQLEYMADDLGFTGERKRRVIEEAKRILGEADSIAERRIRKKFPETRPCLQSRVLYEKKHAAIYCRLTLESNKDPVFKIQNEIIADSVSTTEERKLELAKEAAEILRQAAMVAERKIKRKFQTKPRKSSE